MGAAHGHGHGPAAATAAVPPRLQRLLGLATLPLVLGTLVGMVVLWPRGAGPDLTAVLGPQGKVAKGTVERVEVDACQGTPPEARNFCEQLTIRLTSGPDEGARVPLENPIGPGSPDIDRGDRIVLGFSEGGPAGPSGRQYYFADYQRDAPLALLGVLFAVAVVALGRWRGVRALVALTASLLALVWFVLPAVLDGRSPLAVSIVGSMFVMLVVLYVTDGVNVRATTAMLGTAASLAVIAVLAWIFVRATQLTGLASEEATYLSAAASEINLQGLLLGGIVIGALGVLDDMTVTQVSAVSELRLANPELTPRQLYRAAERIGRDHIASTVNTLVLAYAGASLPLLIFFTQANLRLTTVLTGEVVAVEIVRTLVGSIGLVASVPITTALAAFVFTREADWVPRPPSRRPRLEPPKLPEAPPQAPPEEDEEPAEPQRSWRLSRHEREWRE